MENVTYTNEQLALKLAIESKKEFSIKNQLTLADSYLKWLNENKTK